MAINRKKLYYPVSKAVALYYNTTAVIDSFTVTDSTTFPASTREAYGSGLAAIAPASTTKAKVKQAVSAWFQPSSGTNISYGLGFFVDFISPYTASAVVDPTTRKNFKARLRAVRLRPHSTTIQGATQTVAGTLFVTRNHSIEV